MSFPLPSVFTVTLPEIKSDFSCPAFFTSRAQETGCTVAKMSVYLSSSVYDLPIVRLSVQRTPSDSSSTVAIGHPEKHNIISCYQWPIQGGGGSAPYWLVFKKAAFFRVKGTYFVVRICDK